MPLKKIVACKPDFTEGIKRILPVISTFLVGFKKIFGSGNGYWLQVP
jgi:hypothetical protein